ncbi:hypothetical protein EauS123_00056 [Exiguobacterium phage vB_EauS-123]|nr:hypothetical protein EauS123_00056 [Exiguobacterium phage vB_EauS-123]
MNTQHESNPHEMYSHYRTNDPYKLADELGMTIKNEDLPNAVAAIYTVIGHRGFAVVSDRLSDTAQRYVVAVALYYHVNRKARIISKDGPNDCDWSAANFAYDLLSSGVELLEHETASEYNERVGIPPLVSGYMKARLN